MQLLPIPDQKLAGPHHIAFQAEKRMIHICQLLSNKVYHVKESHFKRGLALDLGDYSVLYKMYHLYLCFLYNKKGYERRERSVIDECIGTAGCNRHCRSPDFYSSDLVGVASRQYRSVNKKGKVVQARLLMILLTIAIGTAVANFFLDYLNYSQQLPYLF